MPDLSSWEAVVAHALTLPGTELGTYYGGPAVKVVANGRPLITPSREADSFGLHIDQDSKLMLMKTGPETFWQTPHYDGYPCVLVRYDSDDPERVADVIRQARDRAAALKPAASRRKA